ncbi:MAG: hypothetical protein AB7O26_20740, partial [Planctomycetaceae bacterium]
MFRARRTYSSILLSTVVHAVVLTSLWFIQLQLNETLAETATFETVVGDQSIPEEVTQQIEPASEVSESLSVTGSGIAGQIGSAAGTGDLGGNAAEGRGRGRGSIGRGVQIGTAIGTGAAEIRFTAGDVAITGDTMVAADLQSEVLGEAGAPVDNYEAALSRISEELIRLMREKPVLVVWMFDESVSMQDDQKEIREHFHKIYEELG